MPFMVRLFATIVVALALAALEASAAGSLPASVSLSHKVFETLMTLPLPEMQKLLYQIEVPADTGGCGFRVNGGQLISSMTYPQDVTTVSFGTDNTMTANTNGLTFAGSMYFAAYHCHATWCWLSAGEEEKKRDPEGYWSRVNSSLSKSFSEMKINDDNNQSNKAADRKSNNSSTGGGGELGCGWFSSCCKECDITADWSLNDIGMDVTLSFQNTNGIVTSTVSKAALTADFEKIDIAKVTCNILVSWIHITFRNVWSKSLPGLNVNLQPTLQGAIDAILVIVNGGLCSVETNPVEQTLVVSNFENSSQCMSLPPVSEFNMEPQDFSVVVKLSIPLPGWLWATKCSTPKATCLKLMNLGGAYSGVSIAATNCMVCVGLLGEKGIYMGLTTSLSTSGLPTLTTATSSTELDQRGGVSVEEEKQKETESFRTLQLRPRRPHHVHYPAVLDQFRGKEKKSVYSSTTTRPPSNASVMVSLDSFNRSISRVTSLLEQNLASFNSPGEKDAPFPYLSECKITYPTFNFSGWSGFSASPTVEFIPHYPENGDTTIRLTLEGMPTSVSVSVTVENQTCVIPTPMGQEYTESAAGLMIFQANLNTTSSPSSKLSFDIVLGVDEEGKVVDSSGGLLNDLLAEGEALSTTTTSSSAASSTVKIKKAGVTDNAIFNVSGTVQEPANSSFAFLSFSHYFVQQLAAEFEYSINTNLVQQGLLEPLVSIVSDYVSRFHDICELKSTTTTSSQNSGLIFNSGSACNSTEFGANASTRGGVTNNSRPGVSMVIAAGPVPENIPSGNLQNCTARSFQYNPGQCTDLIPSVGRFVPQTALSECHLDSVVNNQTNQMYLVLNGYLN